VRSGNENHNVFEVKKALCRKIWRFSVKPAHTSEYVAESLAATQTENGMVYVFVLPLLAEFIQI